MTSRTVGQSTASAIRSGPGNHDNRSGYDFVAKTTAPGVSADVPNRGEKSGEIELAAVQSVSEQDPVVQRNAAIRDPVFRLGGSL
jgi:hypothetical protein